LEISRFDAGAAVLDAEPQDIFQVLAQVIEGAAPVAVEYGSEILLHAREKSIIVEMDSRRIDRILRNLVLNALEHGEGKPVHISVAANQDAVAIAVRDHGIGMDPAEAARVFDRFWRADPARARTTGGSGLGLSIAAEDTKLHNGWLQAWGRKGVGSNFRLTLPLRQGGTILKSPLQLEPAEVALGGLEPGAVVERQVLLLGSAAEAGSAGTGFDDAPGVQPPPVNGDLPDQGKGPAS
jgi:two-component system sensor histidine kinase MtrB